MKQGCPVCGLVYDFGACDLGWYFACGGLCGRILVWAGDEESPRLEVVEEEELEGEFP